MPALSRFSLRLCIAALFAITLASTLTAATPGTLLWEAKPGPRDFGPPVEAAGIVVTGNITGDGGLYAFSSDTGKLLWKLRGGQQRGLLATDGKHLFAILAPSGAPNKLVALDLKTGRQLWSIDGGSRFGADGGVTLEDGRLYVISGNGKLNAFAPDSGKQLWEFQYSPVEDPQCHSGLAVSAGRVFFGGGMFDRSKAPGKFLWAVDGATGKELWRYESHLQYAESTDCPRTPVAAANTVVYTAANGVAAIDASTGKPLWSHLVTVMSGGYPKALELSEPAIGSGAVFVADTTTLHIWSAGDGHPLGELSAKFDSNLRLHMSTYEGTLYFYADLPEQAGTPGKGPLHAMDIASQKILWTHRTNRPVKYMEDWRSEYATPTPSGVYYDNAMLFAKVAR